MFSYSMVARNGEKTTRINSKRQYKTRMGAFRAALLFACKVGTFYAKHHHVVHVCVYDNEFSDLTDTIYCDGDSITPVNHHQGRFYE